MQIWRKNVNSDTMMLRRRPARSLRKEVLKDQLLYRKKVQIVAVYLKIPIRKNLFYRKLENGIERVSGTHRKVLRRHLAPNQNSGKKRATSRNYPKV